MPVRPRRPHDLDACHTALHEVHLHDAYPIDWPADPAGWLSPTGMTAAWVGEHNGAVAGHIALVGQEVSRFFVAPGVRGTGLAKELLDAVISAAVGPLRLEVVEGTGAVSFYERQGWRLLGRSIASWTVPGGGHPVLRQYVLDR